jgi:glycosyltransferase involved in cell wall biosynthesis
MRAYWKNVVLVEWIWAGHHPMYFSFFVRALLDLGCSVVAFCPKPDEVDSALNDLSAEARSRLTLHCFQWVPSPKFCPGRFRHRLGTVLTVRKVATVTRRWEVEHSKHVDLVFFACMYDDHFSRWKEASFMFPYQWSGLYLPSGKFRKLLPAASWSDLPPYTARQLRSRKLKSLAVLDEGVVQMMETLCQRPVVAFPDLTDDRLAIVSPMTRSDLKSFAAGSPIIAALGFLKPSKGILTLAKLALDPANSDLCFAFIGELSPQEYSKDEWALISTLEDRCQNVYTRFERIHDEKIFNSYISVCDVVYAAYHNFADSSGILTKAAAFEKPIVVSDGYLMAERVRKYRLGEIIPEGDLRAAGNAIRTLLRQSKQDNFYLPDWQGYCEEHSYDHLRKAFSKILSAV